MGNVIQWAFGKNKATQWDGPVEEKKGEVSSKVTDTLQNWSIKAPNQEWGRQVNLVGIIDLHIVSDVDSFAKVPSQDWSVTIPKDISEQWKPLDHLDPISTVSKWGIIKKTADMWKSLFWGTSSVDDQEDWEFLSLIDGPYPQIQKWIKNSGIDMIAIETTRIQHRMRDRDLEEIKTELNSLTLNEFDFKIKPKYFTALFFEHRARTSHK